MELTPIWNNMTGTDPTEEKLRELIEHHISHSGGSKAPFLEIHGENRLLITYTDSRGQLGQTWNVGNDRIAKIVQ